MAEDHKIQSVDDVKLEAHSGKSSQEVCHIHLAHGTIVKHFVFEQKGYYPLFGWGRPLFTRAWIGPDGKYVPKGGDQRPDTRVFRRIFDGHDDDEKLPEGAWASDWCIYTDMDTDESGWEYGGWISGLPTERQTLRRTAHKFDFAKRRKWMRMSDAMKVDPKIREDYIRLRGSRLVSPIELREWQLKGKKNLESAKTEIWNLIEELDDSLQIKSLTYALLSPVALNRVAHRHYLAIKKDMKAVMIKQDDFNLLPDESGSLTDVVWTNAGESSLPTEPMQLSVRDLECAYAHALATYGDLETYIDGIPAQTHANGIKKLTNVPEKDVMIARWTADVSAPAFYVAVDREKENIVLAVRGTLESSDMITDVVSRPIKAQFPTKASNPSIVGHVHSGIWAAANFVLEQSLPYLQNAVKSNPEYPILVTGHSMGGGCAALLALLLRTHPDLDNRGSVRAVCLAPAAVMDEELSKLCCGFVTSLVYNFDLVPRVNIQSVAAFVRETASLSPTRQMARAIGTAFRWIVSCGTWSTRPIGKNIDLPPLFAPGICLWILKDKRELAGKQGPTKGTEEDEDSDDEAEDEEEQPPETTIERMQAFNNAAQEGLQNMVSNTEGWGRKLKTGVLGGGLVEVLMEELHSAPAPRLLKLRLPRLGKKIPGDSKGEPIPSPTRKNLKLKSKWVLKQVDPSVDLSNLYFMPRAIGDHMPLSYLDVIRALLHQLKSEPTSGKKSIKKSAKNS